VPLRIAFDLDGVLANMEGELARQAEILFGEPLTRRLHQLVPEAAATAAAVADLPPDTSADSQTAAEAANDNVTPRLKVSLNSRQQRKLWHHVESIENFWETLDDLEPGVIQRLAALATQRRWEIIFLTKRPESAGATAQVQSQRWLEARGFTLPSVYVVQGSRGRIAAALALDIVIDDRPENCLDVVVDSKARAILVWRDGDQQFPEATKRLGIGVVRTVGECLDILTQMDPAAPQEPGMIGRVKRLLGLKEPAST
jgi:hypothetical protein